MSSLSETVAGGGCPPILRGVQDRMVSEDRRWTVDGILLDRGHGDVPFLRLTGPGPVRYCGSVAEVQWYVDLADLVAA